MIAIIFLLAMSMTSYAEGSYYHFDTIKAEKLMYSAVNQIRLQNRLPILKRNPNLGRAARLHVNDIINRNFFEHVNPDGKGPRERANEVGIPYPVSENLGVLSSYGLTLEEVVDEILNSLMESPQHKANILNPDITDMGISFAQDKDEKTDFIKLEKVGSSHLGFGTVVVCQEFMRKGLTSFDPEPFPSQVKKGQSITFNGITYKDFDTVQIELIEKEKGQKVKDEELVLFERAFEDNLHFSRNGDYNLRIIGNIYDSEKGVLSEELVTFEVKVD